MTLNAAAMPSALHTLSLWLHVISLGVWIGGSFFFLFVLGPAAHRLAPVAGMEILNQGRRSYESAAWVAIVLLIVTGIVNFVLRAAAAGFEFPTGYYGILGLKLFLFLAMVLHHSFQSFKYAPQISALTAEARSDLQSWPEPLLSCWKRWFLLLKINATLGLIVLLLGVGLSRS